MPLHSLYKPAWLSVVFLLFTFTLHAQETPGPEAPPADSLAPAAPIPVSPDSALADRLQRVYRSLQGFEHIEVSVQGGIVRLTGSVVDAAKKEQAAQLASALPDVLYTINDLQTAIEIEARVTPAIERIQAYLSDAIAYLPLLGIALIVILVFSQVARFVDRLLPSFQKMGVSQLAGQLIVRLLRIVFWVVGLLIALDILGITALVGAVLGTAGVVGIAIGFAFKDIIENYIAGLLLSARQPFKLNDYIKLDSDEGIVVRLNSRELILMTLEGNHVRIPNGLVFKSIIYNFTRNPRRRFRFDAGIDVEEDLQRVQRIGIETLQSMKSIMKDPAPFSLIQELGDFNVIVSFFGWVDQSKADFSKSRSEAIRLVKNALDKAGVLMPEPIYNVRMQTIAPGQSVTTPATPVEHAEEGDVSVEKDLEEQIAEELRASDEPNLLTDTTGG